MDLNKQLHCLACDTELFTATLEKKNGVRKITLYCQSCGNGYAFLHKT